MNYYLAVPVICILLTACSTTSTSEVVSAGKDTWIIGGSNSRLGDPAAVKIELYKAAAAYCSEQNKMFTPVNINQTNMFYGAGSSELTFRCLLESDPEYKRPKMKKTPDTSIEVINK